jgi:spermidine synthase
MLAYETIAVARIGDGSELVLSRRGHEWCVRVGGKVLMSNLRHDSEEALAREAIARVAPPRHVLIGGLGLGFTLRAVLDRVPAETQVTVSELVPELVDWNRRELAELHDHALDDPRCQVVVGDVLAVIESSRSAFDVIALDVDNGPVALSHPHNQRLYAQRGLRQCRAALRASGVLAVWSAGPSPAFEKRLAEAGFRVEVLQVAARKPSRARHVLFLAQSR